MKKHKHLTKKQLNKEKIANDLYDLLMQSPSEEAAKELLDSLTDDGFREMLIRACRDSYENALNISDTPKRIERLTYLNAQWAEFGVPPYPVQ